MYVCKDTQKGYLSGEQPEHLYAVHRVVSVKQVPKGTEQRSILFGSDTS